MVKVTVIFACAAALLVSPAFSRTIDTDEDDSIEIPDRNTSKRPADDALFNFINKLVNTSYLSSRVILNRIKNQSVLRKQIEDQVEEFLEDLPSIPIPILDGLPTVKSSIKVKLDE